LFDFVRFCVILIYYIIYQQEYSFKFAGADILYKDEIQILYPGS